MWIQPKSGDTHPPPTMPFLRFSGLPRSPSSQGKGAGRGPNHISSCTLREMGAGCGDMLGGDAAARAFKLRLCILRVPAPWAFAIVPQLLRSAAFRKVALAATGPAFRASMYGFCGWSEILLCIDQRGGWGRLFSQCLRKRSPRGAMDTMTASCCARRHSRLSVSSESCLEQPW